MLGRFVPLENQSSDRQSGEASVGQQLVLASFDVHFEQVDRVSTDDVEEVDRWNLERLRPKLYDSRRAMLLVRQRQNTCAGRGSGGVQSDSTSEPVQLQVLTQALHVSWVRLERDELSLR